MKKLKRLWLCRNTHGGKNAWYALYAGKPPKHGINAIGEWIRPYIFICARTFHATHDISLAPGDGPVEVEPMKLKGGK